MDNNIIRFLASLLIVVSVVFTGILIVKSKANQELKADLAQMNNIEYGMFNVHEWKRQVSDVISKQISTFELSPYSRDEVKVQVEGALLRLFDEVEKTIKEGDGSNGFLGSMKGNLFDMFVDKNALKAKVPEFADQILDEFSKDENRAGITEIIQEKFDEYLSEDFGAEDTRVRDAVLAKYNLENVEDCNQQLEDQIRMGNNELYVYTGVAILSFILSFLLLKTSLIQAERWSFYLILAGIFTILVGGVSIPMIDIDARIAHIGIDFMGTDMNFDNQILFFQSKSILDVVVVLFKNGGFQTILVGFLILLFSILFPVSKLIASYLIIQKPKRNKIKALHFLSFYSGKWSMADVFVVAIFMAYIGFNSIIENQMSQFSQDTESVEIITTSFTALQPGFLMFVVFTISGLILSYILKKRLNPDPIQIAQTNK